MMPASALAFLIVSTSLLGTLSSSATPSSACLLVTNTTEHEKNATERAGEALHFGKAACSKGRSIIDVDPEVIGATEDAVFLEGRRILSRRLQELWSPFAPNVAGVSPACKAQSAAYLRALNDLELWAVKMFDSSAKVPSGLLNGNINQFGDFRECLSAQPDNQVLKPRYCLTYMQLQLPEAENVDPLLRKLQKLFYSLNAFKSNLEDPGHRVPRFMNINWGLCVPSACTAKDVSLQLNHTVNNMPGGFKLQTRVEAENCVNAPVSRTWLETFSAYPAETAVTLLFIGIFLVIGAASLAEIVAPAAEGAGLARRLLHCFSLPSNVRALVSTKPNPEDIESVHGVRFFNSFMLVLSHKSMAVFFNAFSNRTEMAEALGQPWTIITRAASLYTDPFIMLSGLLTAYSLTKQLNRGQKINYTREVTNRLARLLPSLAFLILFCTFILPYLGSGPQWNLVVNTHAEICKQHWWRNMLMIHNHFGFDKMCLTHTHHLGIDTQLFLMSPLLVWILASNPRRGLAILGAIAAVSTALRFYYTYTYELSFYVYFGSSISQMFRTADLSYIMPTHRLTVYILGIILGYMLRYCGRDFRLKQSHLRVGWVAALVCLYLSVVTPSFMGTTGYEYDALHAAKYAAFAPITWCLFFAWIIFTSHIGSGGIIGHYMSWPGWAIATKLSYSVYLTQFPIFFYNVGTTTAATQYSFYYIFNLKELICIYIFSAILTLVIEMPSQNIKNTLSRRKAEQKAVSSTTPPSEHLKAN